jgi:hypothetical protein
VPAKSYAELVAANYKILTPNQTSLGVQNSVRSGSGDIGGAVDGIEGLSRSGSGRRRRRALW